MFDIDLSELPEIDEEGAERRWREKAENRFLDFVAMMQTGAAAIRRARDLEERLAKAEADAAEWRKIAMGGTDAMSGMVLGAYKAVLADADTYVHHEGKAAGRKEAIADIVAMLKKEHAAGSIGSADFWARVITENVK